MIEDARVQAIPGLLGVSIGGFFFNDDLGQFSNWLRYNRLTSYVYIRKSALDRMGMEKAEEHVTKVEEALAPELDRLGIPREAVVVGLDFALDFISLTSRSN